MIIGIAFIIIMIGIAYYMGMKKSDDKHNSNLVESILKTEQKQKEVHDEVSKSDLNDLIKRNNERK